MKPPFSFLLSPASASLLTTSLLLLFIISEATGNFTVEPTVTEPTIKKICHQLIDDPKMFIIAIGFAGDKFLIVTNDYTTIKVKRIKVQCTLKQCTVNLRNAGTIPLSYHADDKSFPDKYYENNYYAVIVIDEWEQFEDKMLYIDQFLFINRGQSGRITHISYIRLNYRLLNEIFKLEVIPVVVSAKPVFFNVDSNRQFLMQNGTDLHLGSFNQGGLGKMQLSINWQKPIGRIAPLDDLKTGFLVKDTLVALSNSRKSVFFYPMRTDTVTQPSGEIPFSVFLDCEGKYTQVATQNRTEPASQSTTTEYCLKNILIGAVAVVIALLALGLVIWSILKTTKKNVKKSIKKSTSGNHLGKFKADKIKQSSKSSSSPDTASKCSA